MPKNLTPTQVQAYRDDGFVFAVPVLSRAEATEYRRRYESLDGIQKDDRDGSMTLSIKPHLVYPWIDELVRHPVLLDAVEDLIGPDILLFSDSFIVKEPMTEGVFSMHQDGWRWKLEPMEMVHCWLAFTDSTAVNGCVKVVPRSHLRGEREHEFIKTKENVISYGQTVVDVDPAAAVDLVLGAGEMSIHDTYAVHASGPNRTNDRRIGFSMRFMSTRVKALGGPRNSATLVRGVDRHGNWELEPSPRADLDPACLPFHKELVARHAPFGFQFL